jgi:molybdopterin/thiamine biosynthesis adenylyltransferase/rhodanese-related sulfurtransferase
VPDNLSPAFLTRYARQMVLPGWGAAGQARLAAAKVLVVGAGGLGSPAALYVAAAGVGTVGIVDDDRVDLSNLHRQVLYTMKDLGSPKAAAACERLAALNPDITVVAHQERLTPANASALIARYDVVVNGSDNFPTRYLVNDAAVLQRKPVVDAAVLRFEGQLAVYRPGYGCYRCLFPVPPPPDSAPSCDAAGILGAVAGVLGSLQAVETLKILAGLDSETSGRLLLFDALTLSWRTVRWTRNPACPVCGDSPRITDPRTVDYEALCGTAESATAPAVDPLRAWTWIRNGDAVLVDVRSPAEFQAGHVPGSRPLHEAADVLPGARVVVACPLGVRSRATASTLRRAGVDAYSLEGGLVGWLLADLPWDGRRPYDPA